MMLTRILIIDDDVFQAELTVELLKLSQREFDAKTSTDAESALEFLHCQGPLPHLILLDLHLPGVDGFTILKEIKSHPHLKHIPVIVYSGTNDPVEIDRCYKLSANSFMSKAEDTINVMRKFTDFWMTAAKLPQNG